MSAALYNEARWTRQFLKRHRKVTPSLVVHLYHTHFRFEQQVRSPPPPCPLPSSPPLTHFPNQHGNFTYDSPMKCFLEAIREQKLPTDLLDVLDEAGVKYYEGAPRPLVLLSFRSSPPIPQAA